MKNGKPRKKRLIEVEESSGNVFADLGLPNPEELLAKAQLIQRISDVIQEQKITWAKAAKLLAVDKNQLTNLLRGDLDVFGIDRLLFFLNALGQEVEIVVRPRKKIAERALTKVIAAG